MSKRSLSTANSKHSNIYGYIVAITYKSNKKITTATAGPSPNMHRTSYLLLIYPVVWLTVRAQL